MNGKKDKKTAKELDSIIKEGVNKNLAAFDEIEALSDAEMKSSGQELPPDDMLEKIKKAVDNT